MKKIIKTICNSDFLCRREKQVRGSRETKKRHKFYCNTSFLELDIEYVLI